MKHYAYVPIALALGVATGCGLGGSADLGDDQDAINDTRMGDGGDGSGGATAQGSSGATSAEAGAGQGGGNAAGGAVGTAGAGSNPPGRAECGDTLCAAGEVCCNASCGICTPPGGACIELACGDPPVDCSGAGADCATGFAWSVAECGCVPATPCGSSFCTGGAACCDGVCKAGSCDAPSADGGADCSGVLALCVAGSTWSVDECSCVPDPVDGEACGPSLCTGTKVCCNDSCGTCAEPTDACTDELCAPPAAGSCADDSDCELVDNYCGGCHCLSLSDPAQAPKCDQPVSCFAEPCLTAKGAACVGGSCVVVY